MDFHLPKLFTLILLAGWLAGCAAPAAPKPTASPAGGQRGTVTPAPLLPSAPTARPSPAPSITPAIPATTTTVPSSTIAPFSMTATVWSGDPQVAVLLYHRFIPDSALPYSTTVKTRLGDLKNDLQRLYDAGYSLIPLEDWLNGNLVLPAGRRPLILTMDDLFFADQIFLDPDGQPAADTGIGVLWRFSQAHPDFGFSVALFPNLGDKYYANERLNGRFVLGENWQDSLAKAIVWCIDHNAMVYNHTYNHPRLDLTPGDKLIWELNQNDVTLNSYLTRAGRQDLIPKLDNLVALPFSIWPSSDAGKKVLEQYVSPEGKPVQAIFEADYAVRPRYMPAPYLPTFDRYHLPRMEGLNDAIDLMVSKKDLFPLVSTCRVGPLDRSQSEDPAYLAGQIKVELTQGSCSAGLYALGGYLFRAKSSAVDLIKLNP